MDFAQSVPAAGGSMVSMVFMFGAMFAIMYFVLIRPQQKQMKKHQDMLMGLKKGDEVVLTCGISGKLYAIEDRWVSLEIADKIKIKVLKNAISGIAQNGTLPEKTNG